MTIDINTLPANAINKLVDNAIAKECINLPAKNTSQPLNTPDAPTVSVMTDVTTTKATEPIKVIKDEPAFSLYCSIYEQKPVNHYALLFINDTITNSSLNVTFVAIAGKLKMYLEAM